MSEATPINIQAFQPYGGGLGKRLSVGTTTTSAQIPGAGTGGEDGSTRRVLVSNGGAVSAFVRLGPPDVEASLDCLEILPSTQVLLTPMQTYPSALWIAAIT